MGADRRFRDPGPEEISALTLEGMRDAVMAQLHAGNVEVGCPGGGGCLLGRWPRLAASCVGRNPPPRHAFVSVPYFWVADSLGVQVAHGSVIWFPLGGQQCMAAGPGTAARPAVYGRSAPCVLIALIAKMWKPWM